MECVSFSLVRAVAVFTANAMAVWRNSLRIALPPLDFAKALTNAIDKLGDAIDDSFPDEEPDAVQSCPQRPKKRPPPRKCKKAIKILEQFERLMNKKKKKIPPKLLPKLKELRDKGEITSKDLPGTLQNEFPGEFEGKTLTEIKQECGM